MAAGGAPIAVALLRPDPALAARLAEVPGVALVAGTREAAAVVADGMPAAGPPGTALLVLAEGAAALEALRAGAWAVLPRDSSAADLGVALAAVARGLAVLPHGTLAGLTGRDLPPPLPGPPAASAADPPGLTRREREVLDLLAAGASNKVIARRLGLSFHTAKAHVAAVLQKLGAGSRADAVARGARAGLVLL